MSSDELLEKFKPGSEPERIVIRRFLTNLVLLYDGKFPPAIERHIRDLYQALKEDSAPYRQAA